MKRILVIIAMLVFRVSVFSQVQELEQLKINLEKLLQLKMMLAQAKQSYQTLSNGFNAVRDATKGNFDLHKRQLDQLLIVSEKVQSSPALKRSSRNYEIVDQELANWMILVRSLGLFTPKEFDEMNKEFLLVTTQSKDDQQVLSMLLMDGALRMSDGERLSLMEMIASNSDQNLEAVRKKIKIQTAMAANRAQLKKDRNAIRRLYGL